MKNNTKVRHKKHGEGVVVSQSGRFLFIKYEGYKRPIKQNINQIGVNIEVLGEIDVKNKIQQNNQKKDFNNQKKDLDNQKRMNSLKRVAEVNKKKSQKKKSDDILANKEIEKELKMLRRQFMNRNHHYELEGFVSEETILRRIKELENMLLTDKE